MSKETGIEWTDTTWNPIRGCSRVSDGCRNCYAERMAHRFSGPGQPYEGLTQLVNGHPVWTGKVELVEKHLLDPLRWEPIRTQTEAEEMAGIYGTRPRRIFVNSMSDLFHPNVPAAWIDRIFAVMALCPYHIFQILTKRPERMLAYLRDAENRVLAIQEQITELMLGEIGDAAYKRVMSRMRQGWGGLPLRHLHLGVSVEDQATANERLPLLLQTPAALRFISAEPLLGAIDLRLDAGVVSRVDALNRYNGLDRVICGGESGAGARPMHPDWARGLRDQCVTAGVPFFFKQWGEWLGHGQDGPLREDGRQPINCSNEPIRVGKKAAGSLLDGREWKEFPRCKK